MESTEPLPLATFDGLTERMRAAAARIGWDALMPVQAMTIPYILAGRDIMVQSRTGSGKTGAFVLPILERIDSSLPACQCLVLVPTRELARQVSTAAITLAGDGGVRAVPVYGGVGYDAQLRALREGAHLVVGTPGRILDHLMRRSLTLDHLRYLVFDEADRMLSVGFYPDIKQLETWVPARRHGSMFSATYPPGVVSVAQQFLRQPEFLNLSHGHEHVAETEHIAYEVPGMEKDRCLVRIIEMENPESALIFCNTRADVNYVVKVLQRFGYDADFLSSDLPQPARERVLSKLYRKSLRFLVATDVAARGIDVQGLSHVFLYDVPEDRESYIHRSGRTGRAGASGTAISLVDVIEKLDLMSLGREYGIDLQWRPPPTDEDVQAVVAERVIAKLEAKLRDLDRLVRERMQRMVPLARNFGENDDELDIVAMLLDEYYQETLHAPPVPLDAPARQGPPQREILPPAPARTGDSGEGRRPGGGRRRGGRGGRGRSGGR